MEQIKNIIKNKRSEIKVNKKEIRPIFLIVPEELLKYKLSKRDILVYGAILFFSQLYDKKCFASNSLIALIIKSSKGGVANSISKLSKIGIIKRCFDKNKKRVAIYPLIKL